MELQNKTKAKRSLLFYTKKPFRFKERIYKGMSLLFPTVVT